MARYSDIIRDENGAPIEGVLVSIIAPNGTLAAITNDSGVPLDNPITTGALGVLTFNAADAVYTFEYRYGGRLVRQDSVIIGIPPIFKGDPGGSNATYASFSDISTKTVPVGTNLVWIAGRSATGDAGAGMAMVYDPAVDAAWVSNAPNGSARDASGRGFRAVVPTALTDMLPDAGYPSLSAALTAAGIFGKTLLVTRAWTISSTINLASSLYLANGGSITMTANNTQAILISGRTRIFIDGDGTGRIVGTNTETVSSSLVKLVNSTFCTIRNINVVNARYGVETGGGCNHFTLDTVNFYGAAFEATPSSASDYFGSSPSSNPSLFTHIVNCRSLGNQKVGIYPDANGGEPIYQIIGCFICPMSSDGLSRRSQASTSRHYGILAGYTGGVATASRHIIGNVIVGCMKVGINVEFASRPTGSTHLHGNMVRECGFGDPLGGNSILGGYFIQGGGNVFASGNDAIDCYGVGVYAKGLPLSTSNLGRFYWGSFNIINTQPQTQGEGTGRAPQGLQIENMSSAIFDGFNIEHNVPGTGNAYAILADFSANKASGDCLITNGRVRTRTGLGGAGLFAYTGANEEIDRPITLRNVDFDGSDNTTANVFNSGVITLGNVHVENVTVRWYFFVMVELRAISGRRPDLLRRNISAYDCMFGPRDSIGTATGTVPLVNYTAVNVTNGPAVPFVPAQMVGDRINIMSTGAPTAGTFGIGDRAINLTLSSGAAVSWTRATNGSNHVVGTDWLVDGTRT